MPPQVMTGICNSVLPYLRNFMRERVPASANERQQRGSLNRRKENRTVRNRLRSSAVQIRFTRHRSGACFLRILDDLHHSLRIGCLLQGRTKIFIVKKLRDIRERVEMILELAL